ncbi:hypothetical protein HHK36_002346 [Tetracentron sinense]|uniref:Uncharacterized protein n=1 Tax=Tetracentron sinense TaxID=13715 RepID=A0A834ZYV4_TETSI|nr:hypothetical protein HHK36_002346 [Tetracentron sinense]
MFLSMQPPPPVNDTNPYNVFRPREKAHRLHTRRVATLICFQHDTQLVEDGLALPAFQLGKFCSSEDDFVNSDDMEHSRPGTRLATVKNSPFTDSKLMMVQTGRLNLELRRQHVLHGWLQKRDPLQPVLLFTRPLDPERLAVAGIIPPSNPPIENGATTQPCRCHGRIGRGGRIIFDRWNPLLQTPVGHDNSSYVPPSPRPPPLG